MTTSTSYEPNTNIRKYECTNCSRIRKFVNHPTLTGGAFSDTLRDKMTPIYPRAYARGILGGVVNSYGIRNSLISGFTLLETMVALAIIVSAVVGPVVLVTRGLVDFSFAKDKLIAINLAQEGIELIRLVRDNNVICDALRKQAGPGPGQSWRKNPDGGNFSIETLEGDVVNFHHSETCAGATLGFPHLASYVGQKLRYDAATGFYNYNSGTETLFTRRIEVRVPPDPGVRDADVPADDQMDITVTVSWSERGTAKSVILRERLYNWR